MRSNTRSVRAVLVFVVLVLLVAFGTLVNFSLGKPAHFEALSNWLPWL